MSSGGVDKQRLSRAGNRKLNHALHVIALSNKRYDERGAAYYAKKLAAGRARREPCVSTRPCCSAWCVARRPMGDTRLPALARWDGAHRTGSRRCLHGAGRRVRDSGAASASGCTAPDLREGDCERSLPTTASLPAANGDAEPVVIHGDPASAVALWLPGMNDRPCRARRTVIGRAAAQRLAADVRRSPTASGVSNCPNDDATGVQIWFQFDGQEDQSIVVGLRGCTSVWAADRRPRRASVELLRDLADVAPQPWRKGLRAWLA